jgi:hypothetical protein
MLNSRSDDFLDKEPPPINVPRRSSRPYELRFEALRNEWDRMYPENPMSSEAITKPKDAGHE